MTKGIGLILPTYPTEKRLKQGAILASVIGGIASSIIGLAYEGISSFLHQTPSPTQGHDSHGEKRLIYNKTKYTIWKTQ